MHINSSLKELSKVKRATRDAVAAAGLGPREAFDVVLAVHEATANAIIHGNRERHHKTVTVEYVSSDDRITIIVGDEGAGFDVRAALGRISKGPNLDDPSGRGLLLMTRLMDEVSWNAEGNEVSLTKYTAGQLESVKREREPADC